MNLAAFAPFSLDGRRVLVSGATSGIGRQVAGTLANAGATVVAVGRRRERLDEIVAEHPGLIPVAADITSDEGLAAISTAIAEVGGVDVLVNNAGVQGHADPEHETPDHFQHVLDSNLVGHFRVTQLAVAGMLERGEGSIINITSIYGLVASAPIFQPAYCAAKGGLVNLTRELAVSWARRGVRVNAIAPGYFPTEITEHMWDDEPTVAFVRRNCPMGRPARIDELDGPVIFLASSASSYVTGQVLAVDGGWTAR